MLMYQLKLDHYIFRRDGVIACPVILLYIDNSSILKFLLHIMR